MAINIIRIHYFYFFLNKLKSSNNNVCLCADGLMISKENFNNNILKEFENLK
jgi:hypothetical protein